MKLTVASENPAQISADVLVLNVFEGENPTRGALAALDQELNGLIGRVAALDNLPTKLYQTMLLPTSGSVAAPRLLLIGCGKRVEFDSVRLHRLASAAVRAAERLKVSSVALRIAGGPNGRIAGEAVASGAHVATLDLGDYKTKPDEARREIAEVKVLPPDGEGGEYAEGVRRGSIIGEAINLARHLAQAPGNILTPQRLAEHAQSAGQRAGFTVEVLDRSQMEQLGMNALLGVAQGSEQPPAMIVMRHNGRPGTSVDLALIGKGVTFDTGGISIKGASDMHLMKEDMAGAAATVAAMQAIAQLRVSANVLGLIPAVENMPSGHAMRPGDVLKAMNGKTIEVLNTDAEGRIILADAVAYAQHLGAKKLIDAATLTGAVVVALGGQAAAVLGTSDEWIGRVRSAADQAGERVWPLPLWEEYLEQLRSDVADVANVGGRAAGTITGAMFIRQFVDPGVEWAHLDIAGVAWTEREAPYLPKGPTGIPTRLFVRLAEDVASSGGK